MVNIGWSRLLSIEISYLTGEPVAEFLNTRSIRIPAPSGSENLLHNLEMGIAEQLKPEETPIRFAVTRSDEEAWHCEVDIYVGDRELSPIFQLEKGAAQDASSFNVVVLVPTGIGAEIGGHAGDAGPVAALIANSCDSVITPPQCPQRLGPHPYPRKHFLRGRKHHSENADGDFQIGTSVIEQATSHSPGPRG